MMRRNNQQPQRVGASINGDGGASHPTHPRVSFYGMPAAAAHTPAAQFRGGLQGGAIICPNNQHYPIHTRQSFVPPVNNGGVAALRNPLPTTHLRGLPIHQHLHVNQQMQGVPSWRTIANGYNLPHASNNGRTKPTKRKHVRFPVGAGDGNAVNSVINSPQLLTADSIEGNENKSKRGRVRKATELYTSGDVRATGRRLNRSTKTKPNKSLRNKFTNLLSNSTRSVVAQGRMFSNASTPSKLGDKRKSEIGAVMREAMSVASKAILPAMATPRKAEILSGATSNYFNGDQDVETLEAKAKIFDNFMTTVMEMKPEKRRAPMAFLTGQGISRNAIMKLTGLKSEEGGEDGNNKRWTSQISRSEWTKASEHRIEHGPLVHVPKKKFPRLRVDRRYIENFFAWLSEKGFEQNHAYGTNTHLFRSGAMVRADKVSLNCDNRTIIKQYAVENLERDGVDIENRCERRCQKSDQQCFLETGHTSRCDFVGGRGLSADSLERTMNGTFNGHLKSRAGLDNEDVIRGHDSTKAAKKINHEVAEDDEQAKEMDGRLEEALNITKIYFRGHLESEGSMQCQCIECGLRTDEYHVPCSRHEKNEHLGPCEVCAKCFRTMDDLLAMVERARDQDLGKSSGNEVYAVMDEMLVTLERTHDQGVDNPDKSQIDASADAMDDVADEDFDRRWNEAAADASRKDAKEEDSEATAATNNETETVEERRKRIMLAVAEARRKQNETETTKFTHEERLKFEVKAEKYRELIAGVKKARSNMMRHRSHTARKKVESDATRKRMNTLQSDEAIVVADFKQKILQSYFRENQLMYFAKRGISCLGFMILTRPQRDDENEMPDDYLDASFILLFSNDTTQDNTFINAAKSYVYNEVLPTKFGDLQTPIKVQYVSDGAGSFNCNVSKACMPHWYSWTDGKVEEIEVRVSVSGDGKTALDGLFGVFTSKMSQSISNQYGDITDAESLLSNFEASGGIKGTMALIFSPCREEPNDTNEKRLKKYHQLVLDRKKGALIARHSTDIGEGTTIMLTSIEKKWTATPSQPSYTIHEQAAATTKSEQSAVCHTASFQSRQETKITTRVERKNAEFEKRRLEESNRLSGKENEKERIFMCNERNSSDTEFCMCQFRSEKALRNHEALGAHRFPALNLVDAAFEVAAGDISKCLLGSRMNRSDAVVGSQEGEVIEDCSYKGDDFCQPGCFLKSVRAESYHFKPKLKKILTGWYDEGEVESGNKKNKSKWTAEAAQKKLKSMRESNGKLTFSTTSQHGHVPEVQQIKSFWALIKKKRKKQAEREQGIASGKESSKASQSSPKKKATAGGKRKANNKGGRKEPVKPRPARQYFLQAKRAEFKAANPQAASAEITKLLNETWKRLSDDDKVEYTERAKNDKKRYEEEMKCYREETKDCTPSSDSEDSDEDSEQDSQIKRRKRAKKDSNAPQKPLNAYLLYANSVREQVMQENPGLAMAGVSKAISQKYKDLGEEEMAKWKVEADEAKKTYKEEMDIIDLINTPDDDTSDANGDSVTVLQFPFKASDDVFVEASSRSTELKRAAVTQHGSESESEQIEVRDPVVLLEETVARLEPGEWFDDSLISFWLKWISGEPNHPASDVLVLSTYFLGTLVKEGPQAVANWYRNADIFQKKLILLPVNAGNHWSLCAIANPRCVVKKGADDVSNSSEAASFILHLDSYDLHTRSMNGYAAFIYKWLNFELQRHEEGHAFLFSSKTMPVLAPDIPKQDNGYDCGVFVCRYAYNLLQMRGECFSRSDLAENCSTLITNNNLFKFDSGDITRIRSELKDLIDNLGDAWCGL